MLLPPGRQAARECPSCRGRATAGYRADLRGRSRKDRGSRARNAAPPDDAGRRTGRCGLSRRSRQREAWRQHRHEARDGPARCPPTARAGRPRPRPGRARSQSMWAHRHDIAATAGDREPAPGAPDRKTPCSLRHPSRAATMLNQRTIGSGSHKPATSTNAMCRNSGT